ncbi:MAG: EamA family transporter, partial [Rhodospirillales bacterium]
FASGAIVAPLKYLALIWAAALGYLIWGDIPSLQTALGAVIVAMAGLYIWRREVILERERQK